MGIGPIWVALEAIGQLSICIVMVQSCTCWMPWDWDRWQGHAQLTPSRSLIRAGLTWKDSKHTQSRTAIESTPALRFSWLKIKLSLCTLVASWTTGQRETAALNGTNIQGSRVRPAMLQLCGRGSCIEFVVSCSIGQMFKWTPETVREWWASTSAKGRGHAKYQKMGSVYNW